GKHVDTGPASVTFEIGSAGAFTPVAFQFGSVTTAGDLTASTTPSEHPNVATSGIVAAKSVNRYYTVTNAGTSFDSYSVTFNFLSSDVDAGANPRSEERRVGKEGIYEVEPEM